jgi:hypothetical protein
MKHRKLNHFQKFPGNGSVWKGTSLKLPFLAGSGTEAAD